jgi:WD40-like Beta Propeller Repeat
MTHSHWLAVLCALAATTATSAAGDFANPQTVEIVGYQGHAMEPFISRDGRYLLFNNRNDPGENTDLHWAERLSDLSFRYRGRIEGVNTSALEGVPSLDNDGNLYFVSPRSYKDTLSTVYRAKFKDGAASGVELVKGLSLGKPGIVTFDAEISADGQFLYGADGDFTGSNSPKSADMFIARRMTDRFERLPDSPRIMANINTSALEYAPAISADGLELFFTRLSGVLLWRKLTIEHAQRKSIEEPFGASQTIAAISGFVEAPSLTGDGRALYYHSKVNGIFRIYRVTRP